MTGPFPPESTNYRWVDAQGARREPCPMRSPWFLSAPLDVVVQEELVGVGAQGDRIELALALVGGPRLDDVRREDVAAQQELVVSFEGGEHLAQGARRRLDRGLLLRLELVEVLVDGRRRLDLVP